MAMMARLDIDTSKSLFSDTALTSGRRWCCSSRCGAASSWRSVGKLAPTEIGAGSVWRRRTTGRAQLQALGHEVVLLPPQHVKTYVARDKNDKIDAAAICEAMSRRRLRRTPDGDQERRAVGSAHAAGHARWACFSDARSWATASSAMPSSSAWLRPGGWPTSSPCGAHRRRSDGPGAGPGAVRHPGRGVRRAWRRASPQLDKKLKAFSAATSCAGAGRGAHDRPVIASSMVVKIGNPAAFRSGRWCAAGRRPQLVGRIGRPARCDTAA